MKKITHKTVYLIIVTGIYRNDIRGVFTQKPTQQQIDQAIAMEPDNYHTVSLYACELNTVIKDVDMMLNLRKGIY